MLINTLSGGGNSQARMQAALKENQQKLWKTMGETSELFSTRTQAQTAQRFDWNFEPPPYPEQSHKNLQRLQESHQEQRQTFTQQLKEQVGQLKQEFFANHHYETKQCPDGKHEVALNEQGQPNVKKGGENGDQKEARLSFEGNKKSQLATRQEGEKDNFLKNERQNVQQFLADNAANLSNPAVQAELQRMIVNTQKKAFQLQQNHEDERWKVDIPPDSEVAVAVDNGISQLRSMEQQQAQVEEQSPDMKDVMEHEQEVAALLAEQKELARSQKEDENFLVDPRKMMARQSAPVTDFAQVLPGYMTSALYNMEIYEIEQPNRVA